MTGTEEFANVWDALADTPEEAASLRARAQLMREIFEVVTANNWTQTEAGRRCGLTQPRMSDLMRGRVSRFSLDALVDIATRLGQRVTLVVVPA
jgi:predicted XRE-type DNA-binding protein